MLQVLSGAVLRWTVMSKCDVESIKSFKNFERKADCAFWTCWPVAVPIAGAFWVAADSLKCWLSALGWRTHQA